MKTVFTSAEIAHVWANKAAPEGRCASNMHFQGDTFYSYSTAIARHVTHKGKAAVIRNVTSYSVTTSGKHQPRVWQALYGHDVPIFCIDGVRRGSDLRFTGKELFDYYIQRAAESEADALKPRIRKSTIENCHAMAASYLEQAKAVSEFYGLRRKVDERAVTRLAESKARAEKKAKEEQAKREAAYTLRAQENYAAWIRGEEQALFQFNTFPVAFRIESRESNGEHRQELVSSRGARVPLDAARVAIRFVLRHRNQGWHRNGESHQIGMYHLDAVNAQGVVIGCHRVTWEEVERVEKMLSKATVTA